MTRKSSTRDRVAALEEIKEVRFVADADGLYQFSALKAGYVEKVILANGAVACDGSNGYEVTVVNRSASNNKLAYIGFGSGTEASKADDADVAVAAYETAEIINESNAAATDRCNVGDLIEITIDRDGTTVRGSIDVIMNYDGTGRS